MNSQTSRRSDSKSHDETTIRDLYQQMIDGWNRGSGDAFAAPYTEDSDYIGFDGTHMKGRQQIALFHQQLFDEFIKGSRLVGKIRSVRFLTADVAVMIAVGGTVMAGQSDIEPERNSIHTLLPSNVMANGVSLHFKIQEPNLLGGLRSLKLTEELRREL